MLYLNQVGLNSCAVYSHLRGGGKHWTLIMFTLYFDDSGTHRESDIAVAACLIASDTKWESIHDRWE